MRNYNLFLFISILFYGLFSSCNSINEPKIEEENKSFINEIAAIEIPMNAVSAIYSIRVNERKFNLNQLSAKFLSNNVNIIDSSSIVSSITRDSVNFIIRPKIGKYGDLQINLVISDAINCDTSKFIVRVTFDERNNQYPTILYPLNSVELEQLRSQCPYLLDDYGLISYAGTLSRGQSDIKSADSVVDLVEKTLVKYSKFTNVFSESSLSLKEVSNYNPIPILPRTDWSVLFKNQIYKGLQVLNTEIISIVHNEVVSIIGHHFNNIFIPEKNTIPLERIKEILAGQKIEYDCFGPSEIEITSELISNDITQSIYWTEIENHIELRVVWRIPILSYDLQMIDFYLHIDVLSGKIVYVQPTFIC